nr:hypothetical protein [Tanacetum cinerariifolium]
MVDSDGDSPLKPPQAHPCVASPMLSLQPRMMVSWRERCRFGWPNVFIGGVKLRIHETLYPKVSMLLMFFSTRAECAHSGFKDKYRQCHRINV